MIHLIPISGGKDSQATAIWFYNNVLPGLPDSDTTTLVFCETGNEAEETYKFLTDFIALAPAKIGYEKLVNRKGETLLQQAARKGRFPSRRAQFCSIELKVEPMIDKILRLQEDVRIYSGRRREESFARSTLPKQNDYFEHYHKDEHGRRPKGLYRVKDVTTWIGQYEAIQIHPILTWTTQDVFAYITENGHARNPLYDLGFSRVGCFPCINCSLQEIHRIAHHSPEKIALIREAEEAHDTTFFATGKIPDRFCERQVLNDKGQMVGAPTISEVVKYAAKKGHTDGLFTNAVCLNPYVSCE